MRPFAPDARSPVSAALRAPALSVGGVQIPGLVVPALDAEPGELRLLFRYLTAMLVIAAALAVCVWTRMAVRSTALELDSARSALVRAEIRHERLQVERALLRSPSRLGDVAIARALVAPTAIVHIATVATPSTLIEAGNP